MRKARVTFAGAFHHITCRALDGKPILKDPKFKKHLLFLLKKYSKLRRVRVLAYCIMDNHYHLILQNTNQNMDKFMRDVNGTFASFYRRVNNSRGYVFQDRYYSKIIQNDSYLKIALVYVLLNPLRAGIVKDGHDYSFSSINLYFQKEKTDWIEGKFVRDLFEDEKNFNQLMNEWARKNMPCVKTKFGDVIGEEDFEKAIEKKFNRRSEQNKDLSPNMRIETNFKSEEDVIKDFLEQNEITLESLKKNLALRNELLVKLRDEAGLSFKQINKNTLFRTLKYFTIISLYNKLKK